MTENNSNGVVYDKEKEVVFEKPISGITKAIIRHLAPKDGSNTPVFAHVKLYTKVEGLGDVPVSDRNAQILFRLRAPQVLDEETQKWVDDPNYPEALRDREVLNAIQHELMQHTTG